MKKINLAVLGVTMFSAAAMACAPEPTSMQQEKELKFMLNSAEFSNALSRQRGANIDVSIVSVNYEAASIDVLLSNGCVLQSQLTYVTRGRVVGLCPELSSVTVKTVCR